MSAADHDRQQLVEVLSGCFWLTRRESVDQIGGLDESFFFYAEDVDWCKRLIDKNWRILFVPSATVTHFGGGSSSNAPLRYYIEILRANLKYWRKHHGRIGFTGYYVLALFQHLSRFLLRLMEKAFGMGNKAHCETRLREHQVCLRWLLTGKGV